MMGFLKTIAGTRRDLDYLAKQFRAEVHELESRIRELEGQGRADQQSFRTIETFLRDHRARIEKLEERS